MIVNKLLKMLALFFLVGLVAATSDLDVGDSSAAHCEAGCRPFFTHCLTRHKGADFCRDFVCEYYGNKCQACQACGSEGYEFSAAIDADGESSTDIVKREDPADEKCIIVCHHASCRTTCIDPQTKMPEDLNDALVINESDLINGTVAIKIESQNGTQAESGTLAGEQDRCIHWVCAFRNCFYVRCKTGRQAEEIADMATLEMMAESRDNMTSTEGCRKVCSDSTETMCITLCAPGSIEKRSADLMRRSCRQNCWGGRCWTVCYPPYAAAFKGNVETRAVGMTADGCNKACNDDPSRAMCIMFCQHPGLGIHQIQKRVVGLVRRGCRQNCWGGRCWWVCYPPYAAANGVEDGVASN